ncbi:DUF3592 domain-containing protein [Streptomyces sp. NPDC001848]|uniref:DUF3592 domain-containing protein n=1 Tax=Streptomyces sp. NPDC001848 TaxID=3364618 RepID=UPI0036760B6D
MWTAIPLLVIGLLLLLGSAREVRTRRRLQREGVVTPGTVVRYRRSATTEGAVTLTPVVAFTDARGITRECRAGQSGTRNWPIGRRVPVIYLPHSPATTRIDLQSQHRARLTVLLVVGLISTAAPVLFLATRY